MGIKGGTRREVDYIDFLLREYDRKGTLRKVVDKFTGQKKNHTKTEFTALIGKSKDDKHARDFRDKLIEEGILVKNGKRETASNKVDTWKLDKAKLREWFEGTEFYQERRDLFVHMLKKHEGKEII